MARRPRTEVFPRLYRCASALTLRLMTRSLLLAYALIAYVWFLVDIVWAVLFFADIGAHTGIDHGLRESVLPAVAINLALLGAFAVHHSVMARDGAKRVITRVIPAGSERSTYVFVADALLALVLWQWRPFGGTVWDVTGQPWQLLLWTGYSLAWVIALAATFMIDHTDFVGLRQAASRPGHYRPPTFRERWLYSWVRHPLMVGLLLAFWITPRMSTGHLLFAVASTAYIGVGIRLEEHSLRRQHGSEYEEYATRVPALVPRPRKALSRRPVTHDN